MSTNDASSLVQKQRSFIHAHYTAMEERRAENGKLYCFEEFSSYYGNSAQWWWDQCQPVPRDGNGTPPPSGVSPPAGCDNGALDAVLTQEQLLNRRHVPAFGGIAACQKQRALRSQCLSEGIFDIDLTNDDWQWPNVLKSLPDGVQKQIVGLGIACFSFRLLEGVLDHNYSRVDSGEKHVFEVVRVDGSRCHLHFHKNGDMDPPVHFFTPQVPMTTNSSVPPPTALSTTSQRQTPVYGATEIYESSMVTQPIGKNEAHSACYHLLVGMPADTRIDITNEVGFHWKRFLRTQPVGRDIMGAGIYTVYAIRFEDTPALAFCCVEGVTRIFTPSRRRSVPPFKEMRTNTFEDNYPTVSTTSINWMRLRPHVGPHEYSNR